MEVHNSRLPANVVLGSNRASDHGSSDPEAPGHQKVTQGSACRAGGAASSVSESAEILREVIF